MLHIYPTGDWLSQAKPRDPIFEIYQSEGKFFKEVAGINREDTLTLECLRLPFINRMLALTGASSSMFKILVKGKCVV